MFINLLSIFARSDEENTSKLQVQECTFSWKWIFDLDSEQGKGLHVHLLPKKACSYAYNIWDSNLVQRFQWRRKGREVPEVEVQYHMDFPANEVQQKVNMDSYMSIVCSYDL